MQSKTVHISGTSGFFKKYLYMFINWNLNKYGYDNTCKSIVAENNVHRKCCEANFGTAPWTLENYLQIYLYIGCRIQQKGRMVTSDSWCPSRNRQNRQRLPWVSSKGISDRKWQREQRNSDWRYRYSQRYTVYDTNVCIKVMIPVTRFILRCDLF